MAADRRAFLSRTAEHLEQMEERVDDLCGRDSELPAGPNIQEAEQSIRDKLGRAARLLAESKAAPPDTWSTTKHDLTNLLAEIIVDVGCLRFLTRNSEVPVSKD